LALVLLRGIFDVLLLLFSIDELLIEDTIFMIDIKTQKRKRKKGKKREYYFYKFMW
jgi:hypothetical protein